MPAPRGLRALRPDCSHVKAFAHQTADIFFRLVIQRKKRTTGLSRFASKTASG
jgi:hypothetical protein